MVMPIGRYIAWVGTSLVALLFLVNWLVPKSDPEPVLAMDRPVIRITSIQQLPERIDIDTKQPTIVPSQMSVGEAQAQPPLMESYALTTQPPVFVEVDKTKRKVAKRQRPKVAAEQVSLPSTPSVRSGGPARSVALTKLSFADIISGRLVKSLLNLR
jgi:hypothetical protein